jgi:uncharacterized repeat protein (TIGR03803 family)
MQPFLRIAAFLICSLVACGVQARSEESNLIALAPFGLSVATDKPTGARGDLLLGADGKFYIASSTGGASGAGAVSSIAADGTIATLHSFTGSGSDGSTSYAKLIQASDGSLYGTTYVGGDDSRGTVFRVALDGTYTTLYSFKKSGDDGILPYAGLFQAPDGNLYGTTLRGGTNDKGTVFRISLSGTYATVHSFTGSDGENPEGTLILGSNGELYGTTLAGGSDGRGTIYRVSTSGTFTSIYSFPQLGAFSTAGVAVNTTGANPRAALMLSTLDGNFYGTAYQGGAKGFGSVFRMTPAGAVTVLYSFTGPTSGGSFPQAAVIQDSDGTLYGTTQLGGYLNQGTVWRLSTAGQFSLMHGFVSGVTDGGQPYSAPMLLNGALYGVSFTDGVSGAGGIYKLDLGSGGVLPVDFSVSPAAITLGSAATLTWSSSTATTCAASGAWSDTIATSGTLAVTPTFAGIYTYTLSCSDGAGIGRFAYVALTVSAPPAQSVDGGGSGGGSLSYSLLFVLLGGLLWKIRGVRAAAQA